MAEPNVLDVRWVLSEETGQLMYESFEAVRSHPKQRIMVAGAKANCLISKETLDRYARIMADRKARGIADG